MALTGLLAAAAAYVFLVRWCGRGIGFFIGGLFALNHCLLYNSTFILADVPFALFTYLALNAVIWAGRGQSILLSTVAAGLLVSTLPLIRINGLGVAPAVALFLACAWKHRRWKVQLVYIGLFLAVAYAPFGLWQAWKSSFPVSLSEGTYLSAVWDRTTADQLRIILAACRDYFPETCYALTGVNIRTGFLEFIPPLFVIWGMILSFGRGDRLLVPLTAIQFCGLVLSTAGDRYLLFLVPALYLFLAVGISDVCERVSGNSISTGAPEKVLAVCFVVLAALNLGHNIITIANARTPLEAHGAESDRSLPYFTVSRWLKQHDPHTTILTTRSRIVHYLSGCRTVALVRSGVPGHETFVEDQSRIRVLIQQLRPQYVFTDNKDAYLYSRVFAALKDLGLNMREISEAGSPPRYALFHIEWGK